MGRWDEGLSEVVDTLRAPSVVIKLNMKNIKLKHQTQEYKKLVKAEQEKRKAEEEKAKAANITIPPKKVTE